MILRAIHMIRVADMIRVLDILVIRVTDMIRVADTIIEFELRARSEACT